MPKHHVIDYETFLPRLVSGLRQAWEEVRRGHPRETFYMFGIATDSDVVVLTPFWNTEENYAKKGNPEFPADKWVVPEEGYAPCKYTDALQTEVNRYLFEDHRNEPDRLFEQRKARLLKIFEKALVQLDSEGCFGTGKKRHQVLLLIDRGDCSQAETRCIASSSGSIRPGAGRNTLRLSKSRRGKTPAGSAKSGGGASEANRWQRPSFAGRSGPSIASASRIRSSTTTTLWRTQRGWPGCCLESPPPTGCGRFGSNRRRTRAGRCTPRE